MKELLEKNVGSLDHDDTVLDTNTLNSFIKKLDNSWELVDNHHLTKKFEFPDFQSALDFVNKVGAFSEETNHHPEIRFSWGWVELEIYTHKLDGLRISDFVWCAKIEKLYQDNY